MNREYAATDKMKTLVADNPLLLMVMSRFGISLGISDKTVDAVCRANHVDTPTFLAVCNFISHGQASPSAVSVASLMQYLKRAHTYFLDYFLPTIRRRLIEAIDCSRDEVAMMILKFYDDYVDEVHRHMHYENDTVFAYVDALLQGTKNSDYDISIFASGHHNIDNKLNDLKEIIIRYLPQKENNMLNSVLFDIINCREDLMSHCAVEDSIFVPVVTLLEATVADQSTSATATQTDADTPGNDSDLSERERQIIACVAQGMSNKEIADTLCISVNTVTTHRRNIAAKLQIHSPAALAIYAVINGIIKLEM